MRKCPMAAGCLAALLCICLTPCGASTDEPRASISWLVCDAFDVEEWGRDIVSRQIEQEMNVSVAITSVRAADSQMLDVLIAGGASPDLITWPRNSQQIERMIRLGKLCDLEALAQCHGRQLLAYLGEEIVQANRHADGRLYVCPGAVRLPGGARVQGALELPCLLIRADIAERLALDFSAPESFLAALRGIRALEPALVPLGMTPFDDGGCPALDEHLLGFLSIARVNESGSVDCMQDESYLAWLRAFSQAHREELLDRELFTRDIDGICAALSAGEYGAYLGNAAAVAEALQEAAQANHAYIAVAPPSNLNGDHPHLVDRSCLYGLYATMIGADSAAPDEAMRFLCEMLSPAGQSLIYLGKRGMMWQEAEGYVSLSESALTMYAQSASRYAAIYGGAYAYGMLALPDSAAIWPRYEHTALASAFAFYESAAREATAEVGAQLRVTQELPRVCYLLARDWSEALPKLIGAADEAAFDQALETYLIRRAADGQAAYEDALYRAFRDLEAR